MCVVKIGVAIRLDGIPWEEANSDLSAREENQRAKELTLTYNQKAQKLTKSIVWRIFKAPGGL